MRLKVLKKSGISEMYERRKAIAALQKACTKRPVSDEQIGRIVEALEEELLQEFDREAPSSFIGEFLAARLQRLDKIAYVRFASIYREFADVGELIEDAQAADRAPTPHPQQGELFSPEASPGEATESPSE